LKGLSQNVYNELEEKGDWNNVLTDMIKRLVTGDYDKLLRQKVYGTIQKLIDSVEEFAYKLETAVKQAFGVIQ